jgi:hypothetical protein
MKPSLFVRICIALSIITLSLLFVVWMIIRPKYEASVLAERLPATQQLQKFSIDHLDRTIAGWSNVSRFIMSQVADRPNEGETILSMMMTLHPEIVQMRIHTSALSDELRSQNTIYPALTLNVEDLHWVQSNLDSRLQVAWIHQSSSPQQLFVMQSRLQVQNTPFVLTIVWDAKRLKDILDSMPLGQDFSLSIQSASSVLFHNTSSYTLADSQGVSDKTTMMQNVRQGNTSWHVLTNAFQSVPLWMVVAVPGKTVIKPLEDFMLEITWLIIGSMFILFILGWLLSRQLRRLPKTIPPAPGNVNEQ